jgi:hypothetical protein
MRVIGPAQKNRPAWSARISFGGSFASVRRIRASGERQQAEARVVRAAPRFPRGSLQQPPLKTVWQALTPDSCGIEKRAPGHRSGPHDALAGRADTAETSIAAT